MQDINEEIKKQNNMLRFLNWNLGNEIIIKTVECLAKKWIEERNTLWKLETRLIKNLSNERKYEDYRIPFKSTSLIIFWDKEIVHVHIYEV